MAFKKFTHSLLKNYQARRRPNIECTKREKRFRVCGKLCEVKQVRDHVDIKKKSSNAYTEKVRHV